MQCVALSHYLSITARRVSTVRTTSSDHLLLCLLTRFLMTICGIDIKGSEAIFALAHKSQNGVEHMPLSTKKIALDNDEDAAQVKAFAAQLAAFVSAHGITRIAIKKRSKKGEFAGGPTTFKIEGIIQLLDDCQVQLLSPQTLNAQFKKHAFDLPASLNKYQHEAFKAACAALLKG